MLENSPIADLSTIQWQTVVCESVCREFAVEQSIEKPYIFAIWLVDSGGVCITRGQERHYYQQGQIITVDSMMGEFSVSSNTRLYCLDGEALQSLSQTNLDLANVIYHLAAKQQFQSEVLELIEQYCGPLRLAHRTEILASCQWQSVSPGDVLVNRGERCFHWHIVLHGKLCGLRRALSQRDIDCQLNQTIEQQVDMYRLRGDCFGQTALLGNGEYPMSFVAKTAVRLVKFKRDIFDLLWQHYDNFKQVIATELAMSHSVPLRPDWGDKIALTNIGDFSQSQVVIDSLAESHGKTGELIEFEFLALKLGLPLEVGYLVRHPGWYTVYRWWQDNLEQDMFLNSDSRYPAWQSFCAANANRIIGLFDARQTIEEVQSDVLAPRFGIERWLLICHQKGVEQPKGTATLLSQFDKPNFLHWRFEHPFDSARVMRTIKGQAVALTLRGSYRSAVAQIGVLRQLQSQGIEADMVAGNGFSMLLAAFYALGVDAEQIYQHMVVIPNHGFKGLRFGGLGAKNTMVFQHIFNDNFRQVSIEDMWIPYACTGSNSKNESFSIVAGKLRHALKRLDTSYHLPSAQPDYLPNFEQIFQHPQAKVVAIDAKYTSKGGAVLSFSRWFSSETEQLKGQLISEPQQAMDTIKYDDPFNIQDNKSHAQWLTLQLHLPEYGANNQQFLDKLISLGFEQSEPLIPVLNS